MGLFSCNNRKKGKTTEKTIISETEKKFEPGKLYESVKCLSASNQTYALYLPSVYNPGESYPVVFFFDAHARGKMPVEKYKQLAENYGFILTGSNNSTNGQTAQESDKAVSSVMDDVGKRFQTNPDRIYTSGFSGGARVAAGVALFKSKVSGVIGCAAGFPQITSQPQTDFCYCGIVGNEDFNFLEMKVLDNSLAGSGIYHHLIVYDGKHDWPPTEIMNEALLFLQFDEMRQQIIPVNNILIDDFLEKTETEREKFRKSNAVIQLAETDRKMISFLSGIYNTGDFSAELDKLKTDKQYLKLNEANLKLQQKEKQNQQELIEAMQNQNRHWWEARLNKIIIASEKGNNRGLQMMNKRLMSYLSLISFMYARNALNNNQLIVAEKFLYIYESADPENSEVYYLKAVLLAKTGKNQEAIIELRKAVDKGFDNLPRISNDKNFSKLKDNKKFQSVLDKIKADEKQADTSVK